MEKSKTIQDKMQISFFDRTDDVDESPEKAEAVEQSAIEKIEAELLRRWMENDVAAGRVPHRQEVELEPTTEKTVQSEQTEQVCKEAHVRKVTSMDIPMDWDNFFNSDERTRGVHTESISDALILSLTTLGKVDIEYISTVTGEDCKTVISSLKGAIYQNPQTWNECFYQGWETAEEYLSGNLMRKWKAAKAANAEYDGYFSENVKAIEKILPPMVATKDIYVTLGSPWVPVDVIDDFMLYLFGDPFQMYHYYYTPAEEKRIREDYKTLHDELTGTWEIPFKSRYNHSVKVRRTYGTDKLEALHILEKTLNMKTIAVTDEVENPQSASGKKRVLNKEETVAAIEKQQKLIRAFQNWVWEDKARKERLEKIFEDKFSCVCRRNFDGSFLTFPTMSKTVTLYPYQKDAVARIIFTPNTLLAHDVGAGKTYVMIAAGQELKRMGLSSKNLYVVPNNLVGQWRDVFLEMYPNAKLLCVEPKTFVPQRRDEVLLRIKNEEFDGIIMAYSCFEQIPLSRDYYIEELQAEEELVSKLLSQKGKATAKLRKKRDAIYKALYELHFAQEESPVAVCFDELGITRLFVDEAHNFKNVPLETKMSQVLGISSAGSKKCKEMLDKVHWVQKQNDGKGVVFATGTPITNSVTDAYVMQKYLQSGELALLDLQSFDAWIGMFAERNTEFEIDVDTSSYRLATRFSKFHNLPELTALLSSVADFHSVEDAAELPQHDGYRDALVSKTAEFSAYLKKISRRADNVRQGAVSRAEDNMLKITTDGRKAALDMRLVDSKAAFTYQSKVARCAENVVDIYQKTSANKSTQLIFCDSSVPKVGFNLYDELREQLQARGIPKEEIAFVHDAETEAKRAKLFQKMRRGDVRVLIGSTLKLGLGVNVQNKLIALHHLDVPWRPADVGRILRTFKIKKNVEVTDNGKIII